MTRSHYDPHTSLLLLLLLLLFQLIKRLLLRSSIYSPIHHTNILFITYYVTQFIELNSTTIMLLIDISHCCYISYDDYVCRVYIRVAAAAMQRLIRVASASSSAVRHSSSSTRVTSYPSLRSTTPTPTPTLRCILSSPHHVRTRSCMII
jgi:hypothetical protein